MVDMGSKLVFQFDRFYKEVIFVINKWYLFWSTVLNSFGNNKVITNFSLCCIFFYKLHRFFFSRVLGDLEKISIAESC